MSAFTQDGNENRMRWDRASPSFIEAWSASFNHRESGSGLWIRYSITAPEVGLGDPYCELWGVWFDPDGKANLGGKRRFSIDHLGDDDGRDDGALVRIGVAYLSETHLEGALEVGGGALEWSIDLDPAPGCFQHLPPALRGRLEKRVSTLCAPNLSVRCRGKVSVDGRLFEFDDDHAYQGHRWGRRQPGSWAWLHCSSFEEGEDAVFEGVAARSTLGLVPMPTMTFLYLSIDGREIPFNEMRWALKARSRYEMPTWAFSARNDAYKIAGAGRVSVDRLVQVTFTDPDGSQRFCANSEIADLALELYRRDRNLWRHAGSLTALRTAHIEFGRRDAFLELPILV
jgi:hypothetical protein